MIFRIQPTVLVFVYLSACRTARLSRFKGYIINTIRLSGWCSYVTLLIVHCIYKETIYDIVTHKITKGFGYYGINNSQIWKHRDELIYIYIYFKWLYLIYFASKHVNVHSLLMELICYIWFRWNRLWLLMSKCEKPCLLKISER